MVNGVNMQKVQLDRKKINAVNKAILDNKLGEQTNLLNLEETFRPITLEVDNVIGANL